MIHNTIRNIFCVGRNYPLHAAELGNTVPEEPMIFMKPTHAVVPMLGQAISVPFQPGEVHYEAELVLRIAKSYVKGMQVEELVEQVALGIDFTLRDRQSVLKKKGHPWLPAKGFLQSAPITAFRPVSHYGQLQSASFSLELNDAEVQHGTVSDMTFSLQTLIDYCAQHYGLGEGDLIFTGTPAGVGVVSDGDRLCLKWGGEVWGEITLHYQFDT